IDRITTFRQSPVDRCLTRILEVGNLVKLGNSIVSHDPHLNRDGEALYRFLLARAEEAPDYVLHVVGTHTETRYRTVTSTDSHGRQTTREERDTDIITDFDFRIDVGQHLLPRAHLWTVADYEPAYRGGTKRCVKDGPPVTWSESKAARKLRVFRERVGFPPWVGGIQRDSRTGKFIDPEAQMWDTNATGYAHFSVTNTRGLDVLRSSWTLRQWADDYAASDKIFKEFVFDKVVFGWQTGVLCNAVRSAVLSTGYAGDIKVDFEKSLARVVVRPDTRFQRLLSKLWFRIIAWILLVYPIVWLFQRFHPRGLGRWTVAGSAHALHRHQPRVITDEDGEIRRQSYDEGLREGEWFKAWEGTIRRMAEGRVRSSTAVQLPDDAHAVRLHGYRQ
ncbi:unnamed protein product, partial [Peniophora sp. CBMAI 1063]